MSVSYLLMGPTGGPTSGSPSASGSSAGGGGTTSGGQCSCDVCDPGGGPSNGTCWQGTAGGLPSPYSGINYWGTSSRCCLGGDVAVPLMDGTAKDARDVVIGDVLIGRDGAPETVTSLIRGTEDSLRITHELGSFVCSMSHPLLTSGGAWLNACRLEAGKSKLVDYDENLVEVLGIEELGEDEVFGWICTPSHTFLCSGVIHHNAMALYKAVQPLQ